MSVLMLAGLTAFVVRETVTSPRPPALVATPATSDGHAEGGPEDGGHASPGRTPPAPNPDPALFDAATASAELPPGGEFTAQGGKKWTVVPGTAPAVGGVNRVTYTVEVEEGIGLVGGPEGFAADVTTILADPRGWIGDGQHGFQRVDTGEPDLRIRLTSQLTTRDVCGFSIPLEGSCATTEVVTVNVARWVRGAVSFQGALVEYKQYVVNHEVGHGLGYNHKPCQENGALAPVMMQQSWGVSNDYLAALGTDRVVVDGKVCRPNAWPYPTGSR
ncbi:DUF3152 domain-containing protein [Saccharothrix deserti]|uniref:DUF3152 domain-containing protein n=1 Tax=Saccharothrix deserti TaxID=2593674 RepID=UPI00131D845B|nr:DUF3152 domain-containing protein [Saccharothrix deserti]